MARTRGRPPKKQRGQPHKPDKAIAKTSIALSDSEESDVEMAMRPGPVYPKDDDLIKDEIDGDADEASGSGSEEEDEDVFVVEEIKQHLVEDVWCSRP